MKRTNHPENLKRWQFGVKLNYDRDKIGYWSEQTGVFSIDSDIDNKHYYAVNLLYMLRDMANGGKEVKYEYIPVNCRIPVEDIQLKSIFKEAGKVIGLDEMKRLMMECLDTYLTIDWLIPEYNKNVALVNSLNSFDDWSEDHDWMCRRLYNRTINKQFLLTLWDIPECIPVIKEVAQENYDVLRDYFYSNIVNAVSRMYDYSTMVGEKEDFNSTLFAFKSHDLSDYGIDFTKCVDIDENDFHFYEFKSDDNVLLKYDADDYKLYSVVFTNRINELVDEEGYEIEKQIYKWDKKKGVVTCGSGPLFKKYSKTV